MSNLHRFIAFLFTLAISTSSMAEFITPSVIIPGLGFFGIEGGNQMTVSVAEERIRIEGTVSDVESFASDVLAGENRLHGAAWFEKNSWTSFHLIAYETELTLESFFNPYRTSGGVGLGSGFRYNLPPHDGYGINFFTPDCGRARCDGQFLIEYSVETIQAPLLGDFNHDDKVDIQDFMILRQNFGVDGENNRPDWGLGDANLDLKTNFADFLILAENFGQTRVEQPVQDIPEPMGNLAFAVALAVAAMRRTRRT